MVIIFVRKLIIVNVLLNVYCVLRFSVIHEVAKSRYFLHEHKLGMIMVIHKIKTYDTVEVYRN